MRLWWRWPLLLFATPIQHWSVLVQGMLLAFAPLGVMPRGIPEGRHSRWGEGIVDQGLLHVVHGYLTGLHA